MNVPKHCHNPIRGKKIFMQKFIQKDIKLIYINILVLFYRTYEIMAILVTFYYCFLISNLTLIVVLLQLHVSFYNYVISGKQNLNTFHLPLCFYISFHLKLLKLKGTIHKCTIQLNTFLIFKYNSIK